MREPWLVGGHRREDPEQGGMPESYHEIVASRSVTVRKGQVYVGEAKQYSSTEELSSTQAKANCQQLLPITSGRYQYQVRKFHRVGK